MKWLHLALTFCLLVFASGVHATGPVSDGRLVLRGDDQALQQPLPLDGTWHFFPNRWVAPAELMNSATQAITARVPGSWGSEAGVQRGIGTYWLEIIASAAIPSPTTLRFHRLCGATEVYFFRDGRPSGTSSLKGGRLGLSKAEEVLAGNDLLANLPPLQPGTYHLLVQQSNFHVRAGGLCGTITWAQTSVQSHAHTIGVIKNTVIVTMLLSLALGSLLLGSQNGERAAPWLALMCAACAMMITITSGLLSSLIPPNEEWFERFSLTGSYGALIWLPPSLLMVFRHTFNIALPRWFMLANLLLPLLFTVGVVLQLNFFTQYPQPIVAGWCVQLCMAYAVLANACKRGRQYAWLALLASAPLVLTTLYDIHRFFNNGITEILAPYAIAFLIVVHSGIYTLKFGAAYQLAARLSAHLQEEVDLRTRELREKNNNLEQTQSALQRANETLKELSITDGLTRVHNRMYFEQQFEKEWRRCARQALPLSILMIDVDHFKQLNDSAGHLIGDACLQKIAKEIQNHFKRSGELVARYGGEEFIVLLPDTTQGKALTAAEGLRIAIEQLPLSDDTGASYRITISIGVSTAVPSIDQQPAQLIATADAALYEAKDAGRNRVHSISIIASRAAMAQQKLHL